MGRKLRKAKIQTQSGIQELKQKKKIVELLESRGLELVIEGNRAFGVKKGVRVLNLTYSLSLEEGEFYLNALECPIWELTPSLFEEEFERVKREIKRLEEERWLLTSEQ